MSDPVIYNEALLVGDIEATFREAGVPDLMTDTFDTGPVTMTPNVAQLTRNVQRATLSPVASRSGQRQQQFQFPMDIAGSGAADGSKAPAYGRFLRGCGFAETQFASAGLATARAAPGNTTKGVTLAEGAGSAFAGNFPRLVTLTVTAAGEVTVSATGTSGDASYSAEGVVATSGTEITCPNGGSLELTYTNALTVGDTYFALFVPAGHLYTPVSKQSSMESMYLYMYEANKRHLMTGARGTFSVSATAGEYAQIQFTFTGDWNAPEASVIPDVGGYSYGDFPEPPMVEDAYVQANGQLLACPTTFAFDLAGTVSARLCANAKGATDGSIITARAPTASFNMDAVPLNVMDPWSSLVDGAQLQFLGNIGTEAGNMMTFLGNGQYTNLQQAEANGLRKYDASLNLVGIDGNDELIIFVS